MKVLPLFAAILVLAFAAAAGAQDSSSAPPAGQDSGRYGQRGSRGGGGGFGGAMGRGTMGTVTEVAADRFTIKTDSGDRYTVHFNANTRILKQVAAARTSGSNTGSGAAAAAGEGAPGGWSGMGRGNPPQEIKASDIKAGDIIRVMGEVDTAARSVGAVAVLKLDPATVEQIHQMMANFGKTWLAGKVTAIDGVKITLTGAVDNAPHAVIADENTQFRKRREPATLADIEVGDTIRVDGALKDGAFTATLVSVAGMNGGETPSVPRNSAPQ